MKKALLITFVLFSFLTAKAQSTDTAKQVFIAVEQEPSFPGGIDRFYLYLQHNLVYPPDAVKKRIEGKVFISFVVEMDGSLTNIKVLKGVSSDIDAEACRVVNSSPKWKPGIQNGKPVRVKYTMGIMFKLPPQPTAEQPNDSLRSLPFEKKVFTWVEIMPAFPGGLQNLGKYFQENLKYPDKAKENNIHGNVIVYFIIERDGSLSNIKIQRSLSSETDAEALRVMSNCPKWISGSQNGKAARVAYSLPVPFPFNKL